jgi:sarcosine oxidase subunit beta
MDFVIIGGGVYGAGVAWELAKRGAEVLVLEAGDIASGASGGLGKRGVRANGRDGREMPLMRAAYELWPDLHEQLGAPTGYERGGNLHLIERDRDMAGAAAQAWVQEQQGISTTLLDADTVREMEPAISPRILGALYCPNDGVADHTATTRALAKAAQRHGAVIREHTQVIALERSGDRIAAVLTAEEERIEVGRTVVLLANTFVPEVLQTQFGITLPVWTVWPQIVLTEPVDPMPVHYLIGHASRLLAMKSTPDGRVMISGGWRGRLNPTTGRGEPQPDQVRGNVAEAVAVYPSLEGVAVAEAKTDRRESTTLDGIPIIDRIPRVHNAVFATGWSGHGWAIAPAVCQLLAAWVYSDDDSPLLHPFRYGRFIAP